MSQNTFKEFIYEKILEESRNNIAKDLETLNNLSSQIKEVSNISPLLKNVKEFLKIKSIKRLETTFPLLEQELKSFIDKVKILIDKTRIPALNTIFSTLESLLKTIKVYYTKTTLIQKV